MADQSSKKRANLRDVAAAAEVSVATVSRVLNSPKTVSEKTRLRVQEAIDTLHFVPSAAARAINSGRTRIAGALVPTLDNAIFAKFLAALESGFGEKGLSLVVATTNGDPDVEAKEAQGLVDIGAEALIVSGITHSSGFDDLIARTRLPVIATSFYDPSYRLPTIGYDNAAASTMALQFLLSTGHKKISVVHGPTQNNDRTRARLSGLNIPHNKVVIQKIETEVTLKGGSVAAKELLESNSQCTAILCLSDVLALGVLFELQRQKVRVPEDLSLMGIDDLPSSSFTVPEITTVHLPVTRMGERTAEAAVQWIENQVIPKSQLIEASLIIRRSTQQIA